MDQSGSHTAAIHPYTQGHQTAIVMRQSKDLNHLVEQDQRAVTRLTPPMLGFNSFWAACCTIAGLEVKHALRTGQLATPENARPTPVAQCYALAA